MMEEKKKRAPRRTFANDEERKTANVKRVIQYSAVHRIRVPFDLNRNTDQEIIEWLYSQPNRNGYLKALIREDMARQPSKDYLLDNTTDTQGD